MVKKIIFGIAGLLLAINNINNYSVDADESRLFNSFFENRASTINYVNEKASVLNFVDKYDFYTDSHYGSNIIFANTLKDATESSINVIKIILNPKDYFFGEDLLCSYDNIVEFSFLNKDNDFSKEFYSMTCVEKETVINKVKKIDEKHSFHQSFISLYNLENDYKANIPQMIPFSTTAKSGNVNNQGVLDNYLQSFNSLKIELHDIGNYGNTREFINVIDNPIINLIPKDTFKFNGLTKKCGCEWGYIANTYNDNGNNKITSIIIYDIETQRLTSVEPDNVIVRPVLTRNFKYNYDLDLVYDDGPNNYCLGNPNYRVNISYTTIENDFNSAVHPNVGDANYKLSNDNGICINTFSQKLIGIGKNSDGKVDLVKFMLKTFNLATQIATSKIPFMPDVVDKVFTSISNTYENGFLEKVMTDYKLSNLPNNKKQYIYFYTSGAGNIQSAKDSNKFFKSFSLKFPGNSKSPDKVSDDDFAQKNRQTPLLFKTNTDNLNYCFSIVESEYSNDYTCIVEHSLDFDVFNDNSLWLFRWDPEFICEVKNNWSYLYGGNVKLKENSIREGEYYNYLCGKNETAEFVFGPVKKSGNFNLILNDSSANTVLSFGQTSKVVDRNAFIDSFGNVYDSSYSKPLIHSFYLNTGEIFRFNISRIFNGRKYFGRGKILISEIGSSEYINGTYKSRINFVRKKLEINNSSMLTKLSVGKNDFYTINLNTKSSYKDTYVQLYDENYRLIFEDDDGFGHSQAGLRVPLFANTNYHIVSRFYNRTNGLIELIISNEKYVPEISGVIAKESINVSNFGTNKYVCYLISQNVYRNIYIQAGWYNNPTSTFPSIKGTLYDCYGNIVRQVNDFNSENLYVAIEKDCLYYLELSTTNDAINGMGLSLFFRNK